MTARELGRVRVERLDAVQPLGRHLILVFREFELELLAALHSAGYTDLTQSDLNMLRFINPAGSRAVDVARLAGITKQGAGKALADLAQRGYITRRDDRDDARAKVIVLTRKGRRLIGRAIDDIRRIERRYAGLVGARRLQDMKRLLRVLFADHRERKATA